jgi:hypothetical protein
MPHGIDVSGKLLGKKQRRPMRPEGRGRNQDDGSDRIEIPGLLTFCASHTKWANRKF